jgi:cell division protein FtsB
MNPEPRQPRPAKILPLNPATHSFPKPVARRANQPASPQIKAVSQSEKSAQPEKPSRLRHRPFRSRIFESSMVLATNAILITFAVVGLSKLIPHYQAQTEKLKVLQTEVRQTQRRVDQLRAKYHRDRQPQTAGQIAREESNLISEDQQPVILVSPSSSPTVNPAP